MGMTAQAKGGYLGMRRARSMHFAGATANLAQAKKRDVSNGSVMDGHFDWATPDVRAPVGRGR